MATLISPLDNGERYEHLLTSDLSELSTTTQKWSLNVCHLVISLENV